MDKNAIKKYAVWARRELIERVSQRAMIYGITADDAGDPNAESVNGHLLSQAEKRQRQSLIRIIKTKGYEQVMEEVAYTWFNRFAALRFMEVNGYLPSHIRVFTNDADEFKPQILAEAIHLELAGLDMNKVYELENSNKSEELFKYLLIVQCNALNSILPGMFQRIEDYTELLLPDYLLREGSVIEQMVTTIPEEDWTDQVQIIGWLYQYYNTEPKDKVFADLKKNIKITKEKIPAATQLFTPDWIVHYMVENSLGRLWLEGHPNDALKSEWKYYLDEAEQEPDVQAQLAAIRKEYATLKPEEIRVIDPCMGSGHILCVLFDVLVRIYEDYGYTAREAAVKIVENNLWGLDIDERAAQLSYFAVMMKARQYDRRFFTRNVQPHVYAIEESNGITSAPMHDMGLNLSQEEYGEAIKQAMSLVEEMHDAKEYGSLIHVTQCDWDLLRRFAVPREENGQVHLDIHGEIEASARLQQLINIGEALSQKYHTVITNPPYMGNNSMSANLIAFVKKHYADTKMDLFACFLRNGMHLTLVNGYSCMVTMQSWMFLSSYEKLRNDILRSKAISCLMHMDNMVMGIAFGTAVSCIRNTAISTYKGLYHHVKISDVDSIQSPNTALSSVQKIMLACAKDFEAIPGSPIAYWSSHNLRDCFARGKAIDAIASPRQGMATTNNNMFLRLWFEVEFEKIGFSYSSLEETENGMHKWFPYNKGGAYRKWYGNQDYIVNWEDNGRDLKEYTKDAPGGRMNNMEYYFLPSVSWSKVTSGGFSTRLIPKGFIFDVAGCSIFGGDNLLYLLGFTNSKVATVLLKTMSQTLNFEVEHIKKLPIIFENIEDVNTNVDHCVTVAKEDWNSRETSWGFVRHPMIVNVSTVSEAFTIWQNCIQRWKTEITNCERRIDELFIHTYHLEDEIENNSKTDNEDIYSISLHDAVVSLISYSVGCMFGRYSLSTEGVAYAGGQWDDNKYLGTFLPDKDGIIPICDDEYFEDDIVGQFVHFIESVYGRSTLEQNLQFIADALGGKGAAREVIRSYFVNDFYSDHCAMYSVVGSGKRPIYWLFDSGKKNGFKCLIYMHRYQPDTIARIRTDYVHEQQSRYRTAIADLEQRMGGASTSERVKLSKQLATLQAQAEEIRVYEEKIHHLADQMIKIDLDDGVKHNYEIFKDVLAKVK